VVVSNSAGSVTSSNAMLTVVSVCTPAPSGLVSWWRAEGDANDAVDSNSGTLMNGVTFAPGKVGQAFSFDGRNSYVRIADRPNLHFTNAMTIEAWVYPTNVGATYNVVSKWDYPGANVGRCYTTAVNADRRIGFGVCADGTCSQGPGGASATVLSTTLTPANQWTHFAATYDGSNMRR
jgi:hypothetical protein